jgi:GTP-binding protein
MDENADPDKILRTVFLGPCDFVAGFQDIDQMIAFDFPETGGEVGFVGRSNVGKSSLINALTGRNALARTSHTPGRTQQLNFFNIGGHLMLVDMPGYGFAQVSKAMRKAWDHLIFTYLRGRPNLRCVFVLIDSRHGLKDSDSEVMTMLDKAGVSYRVVLTKTDKADDLDKISASVEAALKKHPAAFPVIYRTSAEKALGIDELRRAVLDAIA